MTVIVKLMNTYRNLLIVLTTCAKYAILFLPREINQETSHLGRKSFIIMTQTFEQYLQQHDGSNEFTNRRREQVLADARRDSAAYLAEIDKETQRNGLHAVRPSQPQQEERMSREQYVMMFNPNGIM